MATNHGVWRSRVPTADGFIVRLKVDDVNQGLEARVDRTAWLGHLLAPADSL